MNNWAFGTIMFVDTEKENWGSSWEAIIIISIILKAMGHWGSAVERWKGLETLLGWVRDNWKYFWVIVRTSLRFHSKKSVRDYIKPLSWYSPAVLGIFQHDEGHDFMYKIPFYLFSWLGVIFRTFLQLYKWASRHGK